MKLRKSIFFEPITEPRLTQLRTLFNSTFTGVGLAANGYVSTGSTATWTANGDGVIITTSATNANTDYISYTTYGNTVLEDICIPVNVTLGAIDATSTAFAIGIDGLAGGGTSYLFCELSINTGATNGTLKLWQGSANLIATGANKLRCVTGNRLRLTVTRVKTTATFTVENIDNGDVQSVSATYNTSQILSVNGKFSIWNRGGNYTITSHSANSVQIKNVKTVVIGDSISAGFSPSVLGNRYYSQLGMPYYSSCNLSAGSDNTAGVLTRMSEIHLLNPTYVVLMIGGNDIAQGIATATWKVNYISIVSQLEAAGYIVIHCTPTPRNTIDVTPLRDHIYTTYPSGIIVDTYTALWSESSYTLKADYNSGDGVHPNDAGHALIATTILAVAPEIV